MVELLRKITFKIRIMDYVAMQMLDQKTFNVYQRARSSLSKRRPTLFEMFNQDYSQEEQIKIPESLMKKFFMP